MTMTLAPAFPNLRFARLPPQRAVPSLGSLLYKIGPLPPGSAVIGACDDGKHLFMELSDPGTGSILILGDPQSGKTRLLRSILTSAALVNTPHQVRYTILAEDPTVFTALARRPHAFRLAANRDPEAVELVTYLAQIARRRRRGREPGAALVLAIDSLAALWEQIEPKTQSALVELVRSGPQAGVWTITTLDSRDAEAISQGGAAGRYLDLLDAFGARLIGRIADPRLAGYSNSPVRMLLPGEQFMAYDRGRWIPFWIPETV